jgi:outer membrane lipoprotein-sorting protein
MRFGFGNRLKFSTAAATIALLAASLSAIAAPVSTQGSPQSSSPKLAEVLAGMDKAAASFTSVTGDLEYTKVTVIVNDHSTQTGKVFFEKAGGKTRVMLAFTSPAEKYVLFSNSKVSMYQPKIAEVTEYEVAQNQDLLEQFLLLGFGTSGSELEKSYELSVRGSETVMGQAAVILALVPKSAKVKAQLQRIELWLSTQSWQPAQQKFYEPSGDYVIARYSNVKWNQKLSDKDFRLPLKGKVKTVRPQAP